MSECDSLHYNGSLSSPFHFHLRLAQDLVPFIVFSLKPEMRQFPHVPILWENRAVLTLTQQPQQSLNTPAKRRPHQIGSKWEHGKPFSISVSPLGLAALRVLLSYSSVPAHSLACACMTYCRHTQICTRHTLLSLFHTLANMTATSTFIFILAIISFMAFISGDTLKQFEGRRFNFIREPIVRETHMLDCVCTIFRSNWADIETEPNMQQCSLSFSVHVWFCGRRTHLYTAYCVYLLWRTAFVCSALFFYEEF